MGITTTTVQVTQAEGWKQALVGEGTIQVQGYAVLLVKLSASMPTDDTGAFEKIPYSEVANGDSSVNVYVKVRGALDTGNVAVWKVV